MDEINYSGSNDRVDEDEFRDESNNDSTKLFTERLYKVDFDISEFGDMDSASEGEIEEDRSPQDWEVLDTWPREKPDGFTSSYKRTREESPYEGINKKQKFTHHSGPINRRTRATSELRAGRKEDTRQTSRHTTRNPANNRNHERDRPTRNTCPDGLGNEKYPAPNIDTFKYDETVGFLRDPISGLHYDANSGYYYNEELKVTLYWDIFKQTYLRLQPVHQENVTPSISTDPTLIESAGIGNRRSRTRSPIDERRRPRRSKSPDYRRRRSYSPNHDRQRFERNRSPHYERRRAERVRTPPNHDRQITNRNLNENERRRRPRSLTPSENNVRKPRHPRTPSPQRPYVKYPTKTTRDKPNANNPFAPFYEKSPTKYIQFKFNSQIMPKERLNVYVRSMLKTTRPSCKKFMVWLEPFGGCPYDLCMVEFRNADEASRWYEHHKGKLVVKEDGIEMDLHYSKANWKCRNCKYFNFVLRTYCFNCFSLSNGNASAFQLVDHPTRIVGVYKLFCKSTEESIFNALKPRLGRVIKAPSLILDPFTKQSTGLGIFAFESSSHAAPFFEALKGEEQLIIDGANVSISYVLCDVVEKAVEPRLSSSNDSQVARPLMSLDLPGFGGQHVQAILEAEPSHSLPFVPQNNSLPIEGSQSMYNRGDVDADPFAVFYETTATRFMLLKCHLVAPLEIRGFIFDTLNRFAIPFENVVAVIERDSGAPYDYCQITFLNSELAIKFYHMHSGKLLLQGGLEVVMYFTNGDWQCTQCSHINFTLRSFCCSCFSCKNGGPPPIHLVNFPTRGVALYRLSMKSNEMSIYQLLNNIQAVSVAKPNIILDPLTLQSTGICVFQFENVWDATNLMQAFLAHPLIVDGNPISVSYIGVEQAMIMQPSNVISDGNMTTQHTNLIQTPTLPNMMPTPINNIQIHSSLDNTMSVNSKRFNNQKIQPLTISTVKTERPPKILKSKDREIIQLNASTKRATQGVVNEKKVHDKLPQPNYKLPQGNFILPVDNDPLSSYYGKTPTNIVMVKSNPSLKVFEVKKHLFLGLTASRIDFRTIRIYPGKKVGSPYDYCQVVFDNPASSTAWYKTQNGMFFINDLNAVLFMHYAENNWVCPQCKQSNFYLRTYCLSCLCKKSGEPFPIKFVKYHTQDVAVYQFGPNVTLNSILNVLNPNNKFPNSKPCMVEDPVTKLPIGLCKFHFPNKEETRNFMNNLSAHLPLKIDGSIVRISCFIDEGQTTESYESSEVKDDPLALYYERLPTRFILIKFHESLNVPQTRDAIVEILKNVNSATFKVCMGISCGSPYNYGNLSFNNPDDADLWYKMHSGKLQIQKLGVQLFMYFSRGDWTCSICKRYNFTLRSYCVQCFRNKAGGLSPIKFVNFPTSTVAIYQLNTTSTIKVIQETINKYEQFPRGKALIFPDPLTKQSTGLCILNFENKEDATKCKQILSKLTPLKIENANAAISYITCERVLWNKNEMVEIGNSISDRNLPSKAIPKTNSETDDPLGSFYEQQPTNIILLKCDHPSVNRPKIKEHILASLKENNVKVKVCKLCISHASGSPYDYCQAVFFNSQDATSWYKVHNGKLFIQQLKIELSMYYVRNDWSCPKCKRTNFSLRQYCFDCFSTQTGGPSPIKIVTSQTATVAIYHLNVKTTENSILKSLGCGNEFSTGKCLIFHDSVTKLSTGLCMFHFSNEGIAVKFMKFLKGNHSKIDGEVAISYIVIENDFLNKTQGKWTIIKDCAQPQSLPVLPANTTNAKTTNIYEMYGNNDRDANFFEQSPTSIILVKCNTLRVEPANLKDPILGILKKSGIAYTSLNFCTEKITGSPYDYYNIVFKSSEDAAKLFVSNNGKLQHYDIKLFIFYSSGDWACPNCQKINFALRVYCTGCYYDKIEKSPPMKLVDVPTQAVAVSQLQCQSPKKSAALSTFIKSTILKSLGCGNEFSTGNCLMLRDPVTQLYTGLCLFHFSNERIASNFVKFLNDISSKIDGELSISYIVPEDDFLNKTQGKWTMVEDGTQLQNLAVLPENLTNVKITNVYEINGNKDPDTKFFAQSPTNIIVVKCDTLRVEPANLKEPILGMLKKSGIAYTSINFCSKKTTGSPYDYYNILFKSSEDAEKWFNSNNGKLQHYDIKLFIFYSSGDWSCPNCQKCNFAIRVYCTGCYYDKIKKIPPLKFVDYPTKTIAVSQLQNESTKKSIILSACIKNFIMKFLGSSNEFSTGKCLTLRDQVTQLSTGLCLFHFSNEGVALNMVKLLKDNQSKIPDDLSISYIVLEKDFLMNTQEKWTTIEDGVLTKMNVYEMYGNNDPQVNFFEKSPTNTILVKCDSLRVEPANLKEPILGMLKKSGIDYTSLNFCTEKSTGSPYDYYNIAFKNSEDAAKWFNSNNGKLQHYDIKLFIFYSNGDWSCPKCKRCNFTLRVYCSGCFYDRTRKSSPMKFVDFPTRTIAVSELQYGSTKKSVVLSINMPDNFPIVDIRIIHDPITKLSAGLCVFQFRNTREAEEFRNLQSTPLVVDGEDATMSYITFKKTEVEKEENAKSYVEKPLKGVVKPLMDITVRPPKKIFMKHSMEVVKPSMDFAKPTMDVVQSSMDVVKPSTDVVKPDENITVEPSKDGDVKPLTVVESPKNAPPTTNFESSPTRFVLMKLAENVKSVRLKDCIPKIINSSDVTFEKYSISLANEVGSWYDYCIITFQTIQAASTWHDKHNGKLTVKDKGGYTLDMYYTNGNWKCEKCTHLNFPLRTYCYKCFFNKNKEPSPITFVESPSSSVCIYQLSYNATEQSIFKSIDTVADPHGVEPVIILDPLTKKSTGLCVFKFENKKFAIQFFETLKERSPIFLDSTKVSFSYVHDPSDNEKSNRLSDPFVPFYEKSPTKIILHKYNSERLPKNTMRTLLHTELEKANIPFRSSFQWSSTFGGTPYEHCTVIFNTIQDAAKWHNLNKGQFKLTTKNGDVSCDMYYSKEHWKCCQCKYFNFSLRTYCHHCFCHKSGQSSPIQFVKFPTSTIAVYKLSFASTEESIFNACKVKFGLGKRPKIILDPLTEQSTGLCLFEFDNQRSATQFYSKFKQSQLSIDGTAVSFTYVIIEQTNRPGKSLCLKRKMSN